MRTDIPAGLLVMVIGIFGLIAAADLERGTAFRMGPGYLPVLLSWAILAIGAAIAFAGYFKPKEMLPLFAARPLLAICAALLAFGLTIDRLGILIAVVALVGISSLASSITRHRETPIAMAVLAIGSALIFVTGLGLAIPLVPR